MSSFQGRYSEIVIDKEKQFPMHMKKELTVEEFYDLMHHVHAGSSEDFSVELEELSALKQKINTLESRLNSIAETVENISINGSNNINSDNTYIDVDNNSEDLNNANDNNLGDPNDGTDTGTVTIVNDPIVDDDF